MIKQILPIVVAACVAPCFAAEGWITDMDAAKKQAAEQKKDLMIEFTGSDWCPPCMQLRANVFSKPDFQKEAQKNFVLVELDYPRGKEQSKEMHYKPKVWIPWKPMKSLPSSTACGDSRPLCLRTLPASLLGDLLEGVPGMMS